ncbi:hypothetical protein QBC43DRAFT_327969 [Cladorrhinum sp. PSN259]|nr:hypothetical protein QBC43DRAFT_327969 [Cladorrhinum sp. PSN259]
MRFWDCFVQTRLLNKIAILTKCLALASVGFLFWEGVLLLRSQGVMMSVHFYFYFLLLSSSSGVIRLLLPTIIMQCRDKSYSVECS